ncbi:unnamed protein product, partial [Ectocarpus sp. 4 AP-2014]
RCRGGGGGVGARVSGRSSSVLGLLAAHECSRDRGVQRTDPVDGAGTTAPTGADRWQGRGR